MKLLSLSPSTSVAAKYAAIPLVRFVGVDFNATELIGGLTSDVIVPVRWLVSKSREPNACVACQMMGRALEPVFCDGEALIIDRSDMAIVDGEFYAAEVCGEFFIRRVERFLGGLRFLGVRADVPEIEILYEGAGAASKADMRILGRVIGRAPV